MKNLFFLFSLIGLMILFNGCKKDQLEINQNNENVHTNAKKRGCGMDDHMEKLMQNPEYKRLQKQKLDRMKSMVSFRSDCATPVVLPIAVHFQGVTNPDIECLRVLAQSQVDVLNNDYQGTNSDILKWTSTAAASFPGISNGEGCFKFCLASKNHPASSGLSDGDLAVTINANTGDFDANWSGYINIFVQSGTGLLGYSPLGGAGDGDGVVIDATAFGIGNGCGSIVPDAPYDLGRTLTHEMGHYLFLDHIWGDGCGTDDLVSDTPESNEPYYDCPEIGAATCSSTDMHMNYMDYTNDACMYMFSEGQVSRSASYIAAALSIVTNNAANVCGSEGGNTATCSDGIQNGQETGIDCGGPDCTPCSTPPTACDTPNNIQITNVTESTAVITWNGVVDVAEYEIKFRSQGGTTWFSTRVNTISMTLSALASETTYEVSLQSICQAEVSEVSTISTFTTEEHSCTDDGCAFTSVGLELALDDYASETSWELYDGDQNLIAEGGAYQDGQAGAVIQETFCLEDGCYEFVLYDEFGDGICCDYGDGFLELLNEEGDVVASSDGYFGEYTMVEFCISDGFGGNSINNIKATATSQNKAVMQRSRNLKQ